MTDFIMVYKLINGIFNSVHKFTVSTYTGINETIIRPNYQIKRQRHTFETDPLKAGFPATTARSTSRTHICSCSPHTLTTRVCGSEFSLPTCGVVWPATLAQLLHFTEGETEAQRAFLNSTWITVLRLGAEFFKSWLYFKSFIIGENHTPFTEERSQNMSQWSTGTSEFCCVFGIHDAIGPLLLLGHN